METGSRSLREARVHPEDSRITESHRRISKKGGMGSQLKLEYVVLDRQPNVAVRLRQPTNRFRLVYLGLQHHQRYWNAPSRALDRLHGRLSIDVAGPRQNPDPALHQLRVLHVNVDH